MKRFLLTLVIALALIPLLKASAVGRPLSDIGPVVSSDHGLHVDLWTDRNQDEIYLAGEDVGIFFRSNDDCYVTIYAIGTDGDVELLFPRYPDDGFVFGGMTYRLPEYYDAWDYRIGGPDGVTYLHAVATRTPRAFRYHALGGRYHFPVDPVAGDPFLAINAINGRIILSRHVHATATVSFFVGRRVWYPRYACYDCHGRAARFDPYGYECPRYEVRLARHYDYWWAYDYYPVTARFAFGGPFWRFEIRTVPTYRTRHIRYVDCALGYRNYRPLRTISRPPQRVVYTSPVVTTRRGYQGSYRHVTYTETRTRSVTPDGTRVRSTGVTRSADRSGSTTRSRSAVTPAPTTGSRGATTPRTSTRERSTTTTVPAPSSTPSRDTRSRESATTTAPTRDLRSTTRSSSISLPDRGNSATPDVRETPGSSASRSGRISSGREGTTSSERSRTEGMSSSSGRSFSRTPSPAGTTPSSRSAASSGSSSRESDDSRSSGSRSSGSRSAGSRSRTR